MKPYHQLQPRAVDDLVVDGKLMTLIIDDENADAATAMVKSLGEALKELALVEDWEALLDVAGLGHGDDAAVIADVQNAVLLEDGAKHVLHDDGRRWVGNEAGLLMELLREEVDTEVTVLAGLSGGGDADDLARAALKDQEIANADMVARDGDGVGNHGASVVADRFRVARATGRDADFAFLDDDLFAVDYFFFVAVVTAAVDGMDDAVSSSLKTAAEGVVLSVVVVISHISSPSWRVDRLSSSLFHSDLFAWVARRIYSGPSFLDADLGTGLKGTGRVDGGARGLFVLDLCGAGREVLSRTTESRVRVSLFEPAVVLSYEWPGGLTVAAFGFVENRLLIPGSRTSNDASLAVVGAFLGVGLVLDVDLGVDVPLIRLTVA